MNITRPLVLASALFALVISGCSQPEDFTAPTLEPRNDNDGGALSTTGLWYSSSVIACQFYS